MSEVRVLEERGSHLLVASKAGYAVVERRNGMIYRVGSMRRGFPDTPDGLAAAVRNGWQGEAEARRELAEIAARGEALARRIW
jgi:hypothetical protein